MLFNYHKFDEVFPSGIADHHDEVATQSIEENKKKLEGLFLEKVTKEMGVKRLSKFYPATDNKKLRNLHEAIVKTNSADHHKISVLYYILLDFDAPSGRRDLSTDFEKASHLPESYALYMKGLWHMDRLDFQVALQYLTHPSLIPTFADEILTVLVRHNPRKLHYALAYYHTVQPGLKTHQALEDLFSALARTNVTEAFYFCRQQQHARRHMFEMLISLAMDDSTRDSVASRGIELVNLPLTAEEEGWFEAYLSNGEGRSLMHAKDTLMMRRLNTGQFKEFLAHDHHKTVRTMAGINWQKISEGVKQGLGPRV
ncbi:nuclear pore complex assembly-domain-containing protein [Calycina marina]|uniref:Nuclear pore complex assembly-domain-containing protein n=1 Tax=Calycina marina TaxID=1763456 RepID=A0A9P8CD46_9HELO|nr:nuclear pore complex assembly-domain-containing protein [Calycina marina]